MLNLYAKQIASLDYTRLDNATLLSCVENMSQHVQNSEPARTKLVGYATKFVQSAEAYDEAYNPSQKDLLSDVLAELDKVRDKAQTAWHEVILAAQRSPNEQKAMTARQLVQYYKDYKLDTADEYMKQTTNIRQMIQAVEASADIMAALPTMGLDDYLTDLKQKNEDFAQKMAERTAGTVGRTTGVVADARATVEQALRNLVRIANVVSIYEGDGGLDLFIDTMNAEVEHFKDILARKGKSSGGNTPKPDDGSDDDQGGGGSDDGGSGGGSGGGSDDGGGDGGGDTPTPTPDPTPDPSGGGGSDDDGLDKD